MNEEKASMVLEDLFLRDKPSLILLALKMAKDPVYVTILSKQADCTYSHTIKILNTMESMGLVKFEKKGRIKRVTLTDDGWDIAHNIEAIKKKFEQIEENLDRKKSRKKKPEEETK